MISYFSKSFRSRACCSLVCDHCCEGSSSEDYENPHYQDDEEGKREQEDKILGVRVDEGLVVVMHHASRTQPSSLPWRRGQHATPVKYC